MYFNAPRRAFTLLETVVCLAIICVLVGVISANFDSLLNSVNSQSPTQVLANAVKRAYNCAAENGTKTVLLFDAESANLVLCCGETMREIARYKLPQSEISLTFEPVYPETVSISQHTFGELKELRELSFFPDGTCTPAKILFGYKNENYEFECDTFSGVLVKDEN